MASVLLVGAVLLAAEPAPENLAPTDLAAYETARSGAGRDPLKHVRLALWCEQHGLQAERTKHLAIAVMTDPANATARGLLGLVSYRGRWRRPDVVGETVKADAELGAVLVEYNARRTRTPQTAEAQWRLALWCEDHGLKNEATAHFTAVVRLDPDREAAWKRLACRKHDGRWLTEWQIAAEKAEAEAQKRADRHWKPVLHRLRVQWSGRDHHAEAVEALTEIDDPRALPMIVEVLGRGSRDDQRLAVQLLGQIDSPLASRTLALIAVFNGSAEVRRVASETLVRRDPREFASVLVSLLRKPIKYEVKPVGGPGSPGELFVEGERFNVKRLYSPPAAPSVQPGDRVGFDQSGLPVVLRTVGYSWTPWARPFARLPAPNSFGPGRVPQVPANNGLSPAESQQLGRLFASGLGSFPASSTSGRLVFGRPVSFELPNLEEIPVGQMAREAQRAAQVAEGQLEGDVAVIRRFNAPILEINERIFPVLAAVAGEDLGTDIEAWQKWAVDLAGYAYVPQKFSDQPPTVVEQVPLAYQPQAAPIFGVGAPVAERVHHACFGAGTPVTTLAGLRPIESLAAGDQVLTQDAATGELSYQPIVVVYHNPPSPTLRIRFGDEAESVVVTGIHRFWKAGRGWTMARELKPGDRVRELNGVALVSAIQSEGTMPVFNLEVARGRSFFVGRSGLLVHDNSLVEPVPDPFDAAPSLALAPRGD